MSSDLVWVVLIIVVSVSIVLAHDERGPLAFLLAGYLGCALGLILLTQWMIRHVWR